MQLILVIDPTDVGPIRVDHTVLTGLAVMPADTVTPVQGLGLLSQMHILATEPALSTWKHLHS